MKIQEREKVCLELLKKLPQKFDLFDISSFSYTAKNKKLRQIDALFIHDSFYGGL